MKKLFAALILIISIHQTGIGQEKYGKTFNAGLGIGYYGYVNHSLPVLNLNYEIEAAKNFTLAPFITFFSYRNSYYWGNNKHPFKYYEYSETVIPIGVKGSYYFDDLLKAGGKWDFYLASSLGFAIVNKTWEDTYEGDRNIYHGASPLYLDLHIGSEYHISNTFGLFLDLSTGVSTFGFAIHSSAK